MVVVVAAAVVVIIQPSTRSDLHPWPPYPSRTLNYTQDDLATMEKASFEQPRIYFSFTTYMLQVTLLVLPSLKNARLHDTH